MWLNNLLFSIFKIACRLDQGVLNFGRAYLQLLKVCILSEETTLMLLGLCKRVICSWLVKSSVLYTAFALDMAVGCDSLGGNLFEHKLRALLKFKLIFLDNRHAFLFCSIVKVFNNAIFYSNYRSFLLLQLILLFRRSNNLLFGAWTICMHVAIPVAHLDWWRHHIVILAGRITLQVRRS